MVPGTRLAAVALLLGARQRGRNWASEVPWKVGLESRLRTVRAQLPRLGSDRGQSQRVPLVAGILDFFRLIKEMIIE